MPPCPVCARECAFPSVLRVHLRSHTGARPFACTHCDRCFATSDNLARHVRIHTNTRPYRCPHAGCGLAFTRHDHLLRHAVVHGDELAHPRAQAVPAIVVEHIVASRAWVE